MTGAPRTIEPATVPISPVCHSAADRGDVIGMTAIAARRGRPCVSRREFINQEPHDMDLVDQNLQAYQRAEQAKGDASRWLADFETALGSRDPDRVAALFHADSHWRDILAFTWYYTPIAGSRE